MEKIKLELTHAQVVALWNSVAVPFRKYESQIEIDGYDHSSQWDIEQYELYKDLHELLFASLQKPRT